MKHNSFNVSAKVAIYSDDGHKILVMYHPSSNGYGLVGGHMEAGETPDQAMNREIKEETGLVGVELSHKDFFMHSEGKLILGYTALLPADTKLLPTQDKENSHTVWLTKSELEKAYIEPNYLKFALDNWPS